MKTISDLLQERDTAMLEWVEQRSGITEDGKKYQVKVFQQATVNACIAMARQAAIKAHEGKPDDPRLRDDYRMLLKWILMHWCVPVVENANEEERKRNEND